MLLSLACLVVGDTANGGYASPTAFLLIGAAVVLASAWVLRPQTHRPAPAFVWVVVLVGLALENGAFEGANLGIVATSLVIAVACAATVLLRRSRWPAVSLGIAASALLARLALKWTWGHRVIDVFHALQGAGLAILHGRNPYGVVVRATGFGLTHIRFGYGPMAAVLAAPGAAAGDVRVAGLMLLLATYVILAGTAWRTQGAPATRRIGALLIAFPMTVPMVLNAWPEAYATVFLIGWLAVRRRSRPLGVLLLAGAMATDAVLVPTAVILALANRRTAVELLWAGAAALCGYAVTALLTGWHTFLDAAVLFYLRLPDIAESLSVNGVLVAHSLSPLPWWTGGLVAAALCAAQLRWPAPTVGAACVRAAVATIVLVLLAKWAFYDYYFVPAVLLLAGLAFGPSLFEGQRAPGPLETGPTASPGRAAGTDRIR